MTGAEFGILCGAVGSAVGGVFGGMATLLRERNKGNADEKKLLMQADQQETDQAKALAPIWQDIVRDLKEQAGEMRAEVKMLRAQVQEAAVSNARLDTDYGNLKDRVKTLEAQLAEAGLRHSSDAATIAKLQSAYDAKEDELEDALARIIELERKVEELERLLSDRNEPDYTPMGGPPQIGETLLDTAKKKH